MATRLFALICGLGYLILGVAGFVPQLLWDPSMPRERFFGIGFGPHYLIGQIPVNIPHNILWIVMGVAGVIACLSYVYAKYYAQGMFMLTGILALIGFLPFNISSLGGFLPLMDWNVLIHAWTAMTAWYYGLIYTRGRELHLAQ